MNFKDIFSGPARLAPVFIGLVLTLSLTSCSNQAWYQGVQSSQERECVNEQGSAYDECIRSTTQPYDDYQKERVRF